MHVGARGRAVDAAGVAAAEHNATADALPRKGAPGGATDSAGGPLPKAGGPLPWAPAPRSQHHALPRAAKLLRQQVGRDRGADTAVAMTTHGHAQHNRSRSRSGRRRARHHLRRDATNACARQSCGSSWSGHLRAHRLRCRDATYERAWQSCRRRTAAATWRAVAAVALYHMRHAQRS